MEKLVYAARAMQIRVLRQDALARGARQSFTSDRVKAAQCAGHGITTVRYEDFGSRLEELLDSRPLVGDDTGTGACRFEDARRRRESVTRHAGPVYVQRGRRGTEQRVVLAGADMTKH